MPYIETSAKAVLNVDEAFKTMTKEIKDKTAHNVKSTPGGTPGGPQMGTGKTLSPNNGPTVSELESVNLKKNKSASKNKGGCC